MRKIIFLLLLSLIVVGVYLFFYVSSMTGSRSGEERARFWYKMLNITKVDGNTRLNRTIVFMVLRSSDELYAIVPLATVLVGGVSNNTYSYGITVYVFPLNYSAGDVVGCGWYDFNISKLLISSEYSDYLNITNLGPRVINLKYRSGEVRSDGIHHGEDLFGYIGIGPGRDFNASEMKGISWFAMYISVRNPMVFLKDGDIIIFPITFRLKYVFVRSGNGWNSLFFLEVLKKSSILKVKLHREGEIYYLNLVLKTNF